MTLIFQNSMEQYRKLLEQINTMDYRNLTDGELKELLHGIKEDARSSELDELLVRAYALVREVAARTVGMRPFDVQILAAVALHFGKLVEMHTGEGKTLVATMPAFLNSLKGSGVHILTFNDYLAKRDAMWMKPIYDFLETPSGYIEETTPHNRRQGMYFRDITYVTAKEAGFDHLRDFLSADIKSLAHWQFPFAIVDEADSILIDEARIPLVLAGDVPSAAAEFETIVDAVKTLLPDEDVICDFEANNAYLTESGELKIEEALGIGDMYTDEHFAALTKVNSSLYACFMLKRDRDYIVKDSELKLVDENTGRIAENRHYPDNIHAAVLAKENIQSGKQGIVLDSITIKDYVENYKKLCGMTGTASSSREEFKDMYGLDVVEIPPNKPCIRVDHPTVYFTHVEAKQNWITGCVRAASSIGQPVLIGTQSVMESEQMAEKLSVLGVKINVLNAKNNEMEAGIIEKAGEKYAVTVSTNMAGRGVDIKLGDGVPELGGLLIIGTSHNDSARIDNQLRGRAGRQGDVGESRFFSSLEDSLMTRCNIRELIPKVKYPNRSERPIREKTVLREMERVQRIADGLNWDMRRQLFRYSYIQCAQRKIIEEWRRDLLFDHAEPIVNIPGEFMKYVSDNGMRIAKKQLLLFFINKHWADFVDYMSYIKEGIHLNVVAGKNPIDEYHKIAISAFDSMREQILEEAGSCLLKVNITENGIDMDSEGLRGPTSTWTYLSTDAADQFSRLPHIIKSLRNTITEPVFTIKSLFNKALRRS